MKKNVSIVLNTLFLLPFVMYAQGPVQTNVPALKDVFANDFTIGCLLSYGHVGFSSDTLVPGQSAIVAPQGGDLIKFHMNSMSPGNWMKSTYIVNIAGSASAYNAAATQEEKDSIDVHPIITFNGNIIAQLNWAQRQGFTFRGHTLVWHNQNPGPAFFNSGYTNPGTRLTPEKMAERMDNFIGEVIRQLHENWPGLLTAMDVVNEAVNDDGTDRTSNNEWWTTFGDLSYVMKAFESARKWTTFYGETQMKLYYNDYNTHSASKADAIVNLLTPIFQAGYLDGIGMQDHDNINSPTAAQWIASYNKFDPICTEMSVTEIDVETLTNTNFPSEQILTTQANQYAQLFKCFVERSYYSGRGKIINVSKDGLNDQYTFKQNQSSSLWNAQNQCKPAFYAVVEVGQNYNALDSLIMYSGTLNENDYSANAWAEFNAVLSLATGARDQNYSASLSAADGLGQAKDTLQYALNVLLGIPVSVEDVAGNVPTEFALQQNYPNPFNPTTMIRYHLPVSGAVVLSVYNTLGQEIATLVNGEIDAGEHRVEWDATGLPSGVYLYRLSANGFVDTKRLILLK